MELSRIAHQIVSIHPQATVVEAAERMRAEHIGAMVVLDQGRLVGILSERDIVGRVVAQRRDPATTPVREIMTAEVKTVAVGTENGDALDMMRDGEFRHLPLVDAAGCVTGMLSLRDVLRDQVGELSLRNADLFAYISADGPGG